MNVDGMYFVTQSCRSSHESFEKTIRLPGRSGYCAASTTQYRLLAKIDIVNPHDRPSVEPDGSAYIMARRTACERPTTRVKSL